MGLLLIAYLGPESPSNRVQEYQHSASRSASVGPIGFRLDWPSRHSAAAYGTFITPSCSLRVLAKNVETCSMDSGSIRTNMSGQMDRLGLVFPPRQHNPDVSGDRVKFRTSPLESDRRLVEKRATDLKNNAFPKVARARVSVKVVRLELPDEDGEEHTFYALDVIVPRICRVAALFEDVDYTAPVWLSALALLFFCWTLC